MKIGVLIGTRPGIIKMAPLVVEAEARSVDCLLVHSGQHYSADLDAEIMAAVGLRAPDVHVERASSGASHGQQTAHMLVEIEAALQAHRPDVFLVCGDANTNLAGALAARKLHITVGHVEAGLRSFDWRMPEEHNRVMIDHISELLFAPTALAVQHLEKDGVAGRIFLVGNTIVDAVQQALRTSGLEVPLTAGRNDEVFVTFHREENVDGKETLASLVRAIRALGEQHDLRFLCPLHPRTRKRLREFDLESGLAGLPNVEVTSPLGYRELLPRLARATAVLTDSGGLQEEACLLGTPCVTLRESTERPETISVGANRVAGTDPDRITRAFREALATPPASWPNPFGDGRAAERIITACLEGKPDDEFVPPLLEEALR